ncbi:MAG: ribosome recycling factor, partial [Alphaproteobacteria bacterium]|nr:ribosome recycling factor [Alphaproteobacteria bacterium]
VGTIGVPEARLLTVQVWDKTMVNAVEKSISSAGLGLNPMSEGQLIRIPLPDLTEERRKELVKIASKYAEQAKVSVRNVRRDGMDSLKKMEKDGEISQDEQKHNADLIQDTTDEYVKKIDDAFASKEKDILAV